jgi:hypothetical protein
MERTTHLHLAEHGVEELHAHTQSVSTMRHMHHYGEGGKVLFHARDMKQVRCPARTWPMMKEKTKLVNTVQACPIALVSRGWISVQAHAQ